MQILLFAAFCCYTSHPGPSQGSGPNKLGAICCHGVNFPSSRSHTGHRQLIADAALEKSSKQGVSLIKMQRGIRLHVLWLQR